MLPSLNCDYFNRSECSSCSLIDEDYTKGLADKVQAVEALFNLTSPGSNYRSLSPTVSPACLAGSRNKAKMAVLGTLEEPIFGFLDGSRVARDISKCPLHLPEINQLLATIKAHIAPFKLPPYDITTRKGELKYLLITQSDVSQEILLRFVLRSTEARPRIQKLMTQVLLPQFSNLKVVSINIQPEPKAVLEGDTEIYLTDSTVIAAPLGAHHLFLGTRSFYQVTSSVATQLYSRVKQMVDQIGSTNVLDLYCGVGAFSLFCAGPNRRVTGVEISAEAIRCAMLAAERDELTGVTFIAGDAEEFICSTQERFDTVIVNPPRRGLNPSIIAALQKQRPGHIIYSSCNPTTLKRDIEQLGAAYHLQNVTPFDMFPLTHHLECLALLSGNA